MFKAAKDPAGNKNLIGFLIWSSMAHLIVLIFTCMCGPSRLELTRVLCHPTNQTGRSRACSMDDTPSWSGEVMGINIPARVYGIAHWQNISPVGDVPLMFLFTFGDMFLAYKAFGSTLAPWDTF